MGRRGPKRGHGGRPKKRTRLFGLTGEGKSGSREKNGEGRLRNEC